MSMIVENQPCTHPKIETRNYNCVSTFGGVVTEYYRTVKVCVACLREVEEKMR